jgi:Flp pilus assembly protein TadD
MTQLKMGQKNEAVASFRRLASLLPTSARAGVAGRRAFLSGDRVGAVKSLVAAIELAPKSQR